MGKGGGHMTRFPRISLYATASPGGSLLPLRRHLGRNPSPGAPSCDRTSRGSRSKINSGARPKLTSRRATRVSPLPSRASSREKPPATTPAIINFFERADECVGRKRKPRDRGKKISVGLRGRRRHDESYAAPFVSVPVRALRNPPRSSPESASLSAAFRSGADTRLQRIEAAAGRRYVGT